MKILTRLTGHQVLSSIVQERSGSSQKSTLTAECLQQFQQSYICSRGPKEALPKNIKKIPFGCSQCPPTVSGLPASISSVRSPAEGRSGPDAEHVTLVSLAGTILPRRARVERRQVVVQQNVACAQNHTVNTSIAN
jgi:hypothetical protein